MIIRVDYMNGLASHREFFSQFVNVGVKAKVLECIGAEALLKSTDEHLNDIPMKKWDSMAGFRWSIIGGQEVAVIKPQTSRDIEPIDAGLLRDTGEGVSCAGLVCIYKEAARQLIEELKK